MCIRDSNYGMHWDFRKDASDNAYTGYYYNKPGDTKGGITIKYSNEIKKRDIIVLTVQNLHYLICL